MKACGNAPLSKSIGIIFPVTFAYLLFLGHVSSNSQNILEFCIITILVIVTSDLWCYCGKRFWPCDLLEGQWMVRFYTNKILLIKGNTFFRHNAVADWLDWKINVTLYALGNRNICAAHFTVSFALLQWTGTEQYAGWTCAFLHPPSLRMVLNISCCVEVHQIVLTVLLKQQNMFTMFFLCIICIISPSLSFV